MLELIALACGVVLIVWQPIEARRVAGGWTRPRFRGTREEFLPAYRRQLTMFLWLGVAIAAINIGMGALLEDDPARRIARFVTAAVWLGVAASAFLSRRIADAPPTLTPRRPRATAAPHCTEGRMAKELTVGIAGLGAIGLHLARALDAGVQGLRLAAVSARDLTKARATTGGFKHPPMVVSNAELAACDIVVEAAPAAAFEEIATAAIEAGRIFVPSSVGALLPRMHLVERARQTGARIVVPTGALLGLDAVRAAAEGAVDSVTIETRKPPRGLEGAPYLKQNAIDLGAITTATRVFKGNAFDAAQGFPANVNVAAALALAGIGPERTMVEIWADPAQTRNQHTIRVEAASARLTMTIENVPSEENPRTGKITPLSILACLRGLTSTLKVGS